MNTILYKPKKIPCKTVTSKPNLSEDSGKASQRNQPRAKIRGMIIGTFGKDREN